MDESESSRSQDRELAELFGNDTLERKALHADVLSRMFGQVEPEAQQMLGRYEVIRKLGSGGMGVVYLARDPELDREVAIKLLRPGEGTQSGDIEVRLRDEARAMAKVNHAHVVHVHDVGRYGEQLFIAMEYVPGCTLTEWLEGTHSFSERLRMFIDAGEGLCAAHEADLVHRDFKPDNVLLGDDEVVKVTDFGIAVATDPWETSTDANPDTREQLAPAVAGTLRYMSPEQLRGHVLDARSDQFSFCVSLYTALVGQPPFAPQHPGALLNAIVTGQRLPLPRNHGVPRWVLHALWRGMSPEPSQRWPSMRALLDRLRDDPVVKRRRWALGTTAAAILSLAAFSVGRGATTAPDADDAERRARERARLTTACTEEGDRIDTLWNDDVRARLHRGIASVDVGYAADTADKVLPYFDAQAEAIRSAQTAACLDHRVHHTWDETLHQRATGCLDERRMQLKALVDEFSEADLASVSRATVAAATLLETESCRNEHRLGLMPAPPHDTAAIAEVTRQIYLTNAQVAAGHYDDAFTTASAALDRARAIGWPVLEARARYRYGISLENTNKPAEAEAELEQAYFQAAKSGALELQADIAQRLLFTVGDRNQRPEDGLRWGRHAALALDALQEPDNGLRRTLLDGDLGTIHGRAGNFDEALRLMRRELADHEALVGAEHPEQANLLNNLANVHLRRGAFEKSRALHQRALEIATNTLGPAHPIVATILLNLGQAHQRQGDFPEAIETLQRSIDLLEDAVGSEHTTTIVAMMNLGSVYLAMEDHARAIPIFERSRAVVAKTFGEDHDMMGRVLNNLAVAHIDRGDYDRAITLSERALAIKEATLGPEHAEIANTLVNLAKLRMLTDDVDQARRLHERALSIREDSLGPMHTEVADSLIGLARVHQRLGHLDRARDMLERSLAIQHEAFGPEHLAVAEVLVARAEFEYDEGAPARALPLLERALPILVASIGAEHPDVADARFTLARVLWDTKPREGQDRRRARALAQQALEHTDPGPARGELVRWLDTHAP